MRVHPRRPALPWRVRLDLFLRRWAACMVYRRAKRNGDPIATYLAALEMHFPGIVRGKPYDPEEEPNNAWVAFQGIRFHLKNENIGYMEAVLAEKGLEAGTDYFTRHYAGKVTWDGYQFRIERDPNVCGPDDPLWNQVYTKGMTPEQVQALRDGRVRTVGFSDLQTGHKAEMDMFFERYGQSSRAQG